MLETIFAGFLTPPWLAAFTSIILLDLMLSGDNAIMIALASRNLPPHHRSRAIIIGGIGAVLIRIACTLFATGLLATPGLRALGGAALLVIAVNLIAENHGAGGEQEQVAQPKTLGAAVRTILVADFIMSMDNILSLAGVANTVPEGKWGLIICGLLVSIPIVLFGAQIFLLIMLKLPVLIYLGAGILGYTAVQLIVEDMLVGSYFVPFTLPLEILSILAIWGIGWYRGKKRAAKS